MSAASGWEIMIKFQWGRLLLPEEPERYLLDQIRSNAFQTLPIRMEHAFHLLRLPAHHKDPFDRMLFAQAQFENIPILNLDIAKAEEASDPRRPGRSCIRIPRALENEGDEASHGFPEG